MDKFMNGNIKKEYKRVIRNIIIGIILLGLAVLCWFWRKQEIASANKNIKDLNTIISSKEKENQKSYLNVKSIPYKFAVYDDTTDSYYIVSDGKYMYILYMSVADFNKLNKEDIYERAMKVEGITKMTTKDVKQLAIDTYNTTIEKQEEKLTLADFENYFGAVYLDMTALDGAVAFVPMACFYLLLLFGGILFIVATFNFIKFNREIKKLDANQISKLDMEMNDPNAFYYQKARLYLTQNYIINFASGFHAINYKDILWMYPFEQRTNGIKTSQSIRIFTNYGKTYTIASLDIITKQKKEIYNEIWNTIYNKNEKILTGYTKENIKMMNQKLKEIRKNR